MSDKAVQFRPIAAPLDVTDSALDVVNRQLGVPTLTKPAAQPEPGPVRAPVEKLTIEIPDYLADALRREAAAGRSAAKYLVMLALRKDGYRVDDADLVPDGRRSKSKPR